MTLNTFISSMALSDTSSTCVLHLLPGNFCLLQTNDPNRIVNWLRRFFFTSSCARGTDGKERKHRNLNLFASHSSLRANFSAGDGDSGQNVSLTSLLKKIKTMLKKRLTTSSLALWPCLQNGCRSKINASVTRKPLSKEHPFHNKVWATLPVIFLPFLSSAASCLLGCHTKGWVHRRNVQTRVTRVH